MFKEKIKEFFKEFFDTKLKIAATIVSLAWFILYFATGSAIFSKMWNTSPALPIIGGIFAIVPIVIQIVNLFFFKNKWVSIYNIVVSIIFAIVHFLFFAFVLSKLSYFLSAGTPYFITIGLFALIGFFVFGYPKLKKLYKQITASAITIAIFIICIVCLFDATPFYLEPSATVFAVEDEYQIAFSTSHKSIGAIEIDGTKYYDASDGENNVSTLHKIAVPGNVLDNAKKYTILTQGVHLNTAYLPTKGKKISKEFTFRPIDESDGIQIYNLSDTHECLSGPGKAGSYFGDKLDLLILNGDVINEVSTESQVSIIYKTAFKVTGGTRPVIYTRGNHECNGKLAANLSKYVGSTENGMYYTYNIGNSVSMLILDTNNDMADSNALISPIANFEQIRRAQTEWIKENSDWNKSTFNFVIAHMSYPLSGYLDEHCSWHDWAKELVELTNGKTDLLISGHSHRADFHPVNSEENKFANYPVLRGSLRSNKYTDREGVSPNEFTGTAIEINGTNISIKFTNAKHECKKEITSLK